MNTVFMHFHGQVGQCLKLGILEFSLFRTKIAELLRARSSKSGALQIRFKKYVERMREGHNDVFFLIGVSLAAVSSSSVVDLFRQKGLEVLFMIDPGDECVVQLLEEFEFDGQKLKSSSEAV